MELSTPKPANGHSKFPYLWKNNHNLLLPFVIKEQYEQIKHHLLETGAILFRDFGIDSISSLQTCVSAFPGEPLDYVDGNSPRTKLEGKVYTSTEFPPEAFISLHNELSYAKTWPRTIFFCCQAPASEGGSTAIADSRKILKQLSVEIKDTFVKKGVQYIRNLHGGLGAGPSWQDTFETDSRAAVEAYCKHNDIYFEWTGTENLRLIQRRKAVITHPETKEEVWFNQADQFHPSTNTTEVYEALLEIYEDDPHSMPHYACFSDGSEIPLDVLEEIRRVTKVNTIIFPWEKGDLMIVDNILTAHGRTPFKGPRKILVSMLA